MEVQGIPTTGCNVFYGTYIDNYVGNTRTRYYIYEGQVIRSQTSTNTNQPTGSICMTESLEYKPELKLYMEVGGIILSGIIMAIAVKIVLGKVICGR